MAKETKAKKTAGQDEESKKGAEERLKKAAENRKK